MVDKQDNMEHLLEIMKIVMLAKTKDEMQQDAIEYLISNPNLLINCLRSICSNETLCKVDDAEPSILSPFRSADDSVQSGSSRMDIADDESSGSSDIDDTSSIASQESFQTDNVDEDCPEESVTLDDVGVTCFPSAHSIGPHTSIISDTPMNFPDEIGSDEKEQK